MPRGPDFLLVGPQKTGTTSLHQMLLLHPQVVSSTVKELHFFQDDRNYEQGIDWYLDQFPESSDSEIAFEATPNYFAHARARQRIFDFKPNMKIVCLFRNPVDRLLSAFKHFHALSIIHNSKQLSEKKFAKNGPSKFSSWGGEKRTLGQIIEEFELNQPECDQYFRPGEYIVHLKEWQELFGVSRVHPILFDELIAEPVVTNGKLFQFLGITQRRLPLTQHNSSKDWVTLVPEIKELIQPEHIDYLKKHYSQYNEQLAEHLGKELPWD